MEQLECVDDAMNLIQLFRFCCCFASKSDAESEAYKKTLSRFILSTTRDWRRGKRRINCIKTSTSAATSKINRAISKIRDKHSPSHQREALSGVSREPFTQNNCWLRIARLSQVRLTFPSCSYQQERRRRVFGGDRRRTWETLSFRDICFLRWALCSSLLQLYSMIPFFEIRTQLRQEEDAPKTFEHSSLVHIKRTSLSHFDMFNLEDISWA